MPVDSLLADAASKIRPKLTNSNRARRVYIDSTTEVLTAVSSSGSLIKQIDDTHNQTIAGAKTFTGAVVTTATGAEQTVVATLTNAQVLALRATPITVVAAPAAGFALILTGGQITITYTAAYTESSANLALRYTNGSGLQASGSIEATGFADATASSMVPIVPIQPTTAPVPAAAALVLHGEGAGEWGGGNAANVMTVTVRYRLVAVP